MVRVEGFTSARNAHAHVLKHVVRVSEQERHELESASDPEKWADLIPDPPLRVDVHQRRIRTVEQLRAVPGCVAGQRGATSSKPCSDCQDRRAIAVVSSKMQDLLTHYLSVAQGALDYAFANPDRYGPRIVAYRVDTGTKFETVDERHVRVLGFVEKNETASLLTCHRDVNRPLKSRWMELARIRAAHRRAGTLVALGKANHVDA